MLGKLTRKLTKQEWLPGHDMTYIRYNESNHHQLQIGPSKPKTGINFVLTEREKS